MKLIVKTKNLELDSFLDNLIKKRMATANKIVNAFQESAELFIEVERTTKHHKRGDVFSAEAIINLPGRKLVARAHGENLGKVVTVIKEELLREIRKYKTKTIEMPRRKYRKIKRQVL